MNKHHQSDIYHGSGKGKEEIMRHSCEHVMAAAIMSLWPKTKRGVGPAIEYGFYQDIDIPNHQLMPDDLKKIEQEMQKIKKNALPFIKEEKNINDAIKYEKEKNQTYKVEILEELKKQGEIKVTYYQIGDYIDLCRGPHVEDTSKIGDFHLNKLAGAYWRGSETNPMLQRVYGLCFNDKKSLKKYLWQLKEAKKRDHRILGKKLDLFIIDDNIGKGLPLLTPKGTIIRNEIKNYEKQLEWENGFDHVTTPHIAKSVLYKKTGHWQHYKDVMYEPFGIEGEEYVLKPMNCPHHYMIYASKPRSYKDLPIRLSEAGTCYRFEKTGELSGLVRVRSLTIDDAHILMREDQIEEEFARCIQMVDRMFKAFKLNDYYVRLSLSDPSDAIKYIADKDTWDKAKEKLEKIVKQNNLSYEIAEGEASFYGPKIDYMVKDSIGREWQMSTLQLDLFMAKRLGLVFTNSKGEEENPVILHRGLTGSLERTLAILIEHFAGAFPLWLSPVQIVIIPIADRHKKKAKEITEKLHKKKIRVYLDDRSESMQSKIRQATLQKAPYMGIIGDKEIEKSSKDKKSSYISVRTREGKDEGSQDLTKFIKRIEKEIQKKT